MNKVGGRITTVGSLNGDMTAKGKMSGRVKSAETKPYPPYEGEYIIEPTFEKQVLDTTKKSLYEDITINEIRQTEVTNPSGGLTITIG